MTTYIQKRTGNEASLFDVFNDEFFKPMFQTGPQDLKTNFRESETSYELEVETPGYTKDQIKVSLEDGYLTVSCSKQQKTEENPSGRYLRREISESCRRSYYVGDEISQDQIKAKYENGMLMLILPKALPKQSESRFISIE